MERVLRIPNVAPLWTGFRTWSLLLHEELDRIPFCNSVAQIVKAWICHQQWSWVCFAAKGDRHEMPWLTEVHDNRHLPEGMQLKSFIVFCMLQCSVEFELALKVKVLITKVWREVTLCIFYETSKIKEYIFLNKGKYSLYSIWNMWTKKVFFWYHMEFYNILLTLRIF